ncbi:pyridoxal phosphate-dependent aminotransferase [Emergencia sp.]|uniref:pyridoxal phosphate-dependent aminotransferase n=1 Tax=Emergencia sp. TaxID=1926557 RepID=UPI003AF162D3
MNELRFSKLAANYPASGIRRMFDLAAKYDDAIKLTVGEPNFETPGYIKEAAKKALDDGKVFYAPNAGIPELREAIADKYRIYDNGYTKENVIVTTGALEGLILSFMSFLNPGDEVLVTDPCFPNYYGQLQSVGAIPVSVPTYEKYEYRVQAEDIENTITAKTKAIIINSPCNPTGAVLTESDIRSIAQIVKKNELIVFSDEPYDCIVFDGQRPFSMAQLKEMKDNVIILNSFSKSYAMTGWRIGYIVVPDGYSQKMAEVQEGIVSCVSTFSQYAAVEALKSDRCIKEMLAEYTRRRDILIDGLNKVPGITCPKTKGSFYAFANIKAFGKTSQEFAEELVERARVVVVPGSAFGKMGEGYIRLVFANSDDNLKEAVRRIDNHVRKNYPALC